ncbi:nucleotidyltransferase domain-containing protein [Streptomyces atratus]|uniref:nucleotidyltransferase domain-containing protein n=1 Tax=Streptomyces atratus TaxID=1893 RepID=UPI00224F5B6D|nr:nucleotidyltransferase domain-containing protein [Streptomyces atratus]MCX5343521.1 nucleotidyltransferase domain-containing protein [Streptomyces atratus]
MNADEAQPTRLLLDRFIADAAHAVAPEAVWAHGSLALGDYQPGRSDLDLVALVESPVTETQRRQLIHLHRALITNVPMAAKLHCSYVVRSQLPDVGRDHVTWAQGRLFERPVTPVSRRELSTGGLSLFGPEPAGLVAEVSDQALAEFIRGDLKGYWYPASARPTRWLRDIWVDLGLLTLARASVTLRDGRLITKGQALEVLAELGAPAEVVGDIHRRRYGTDPRRASLPWRIRRGRLARTFVRAGIERTLSQRSGS